MWGATTAASSARTSTGAATSSADAPGPPRQRPESGLAPAHGLRAGTGGVFTRADHLRKGTRHVVLNLATDENVEPRPAEPDPAPSRAVPPPAGGARGPRCAQHADCHQQP